MDGQLEPRSTEGDQADGGSFGDRLLSVMTESSPAPIVIVDRHGAVVTANPAFLTTFGFAEAEVLGCTLEDLFGPDSALVTALDLEGGPTSGSIVVGAEVHHRGADLPFLATRFAIAGAGGDLEAAGLILVDLAFRRRATSVMERFEEARQRQERAEAANRAKSEFLSRMSHELRTPLNSIVGFTQLLASSDLPPAEQQFVDLIERAGKHLVQLINDVLDVAGIEAGKLTLSIEPVDVHDAIAQAVDLVDVTARSADVRISVTGDDAGGWVLADSQRLAQILLNLLSNAIRYNRPGGSVTVEVGFDEARGQVLIAVSDTGSGIPAELLPRVFEPFERLGAEQTGIEGSGMGLSVSKGLAEQMGGDITAASAPGRGSTFTVSLPAAPAQVVPPVPGRGGGAAVADEPTLSVLYIEDNSANLLLMEHALAAKGSVNLHSARTGQAGLDLLEATEVDLVMIDLHLPDMDGTEVLRRIRHNGRQPDVTVVIVSADAMADRIAQLRAQGADYYLTKPIDLSELYATLDRVRSKRPTP